MPYRDVVSWNAAIEADALNGQLLQAAKLFAEAPVKDLASCRPTDRTSCRQKPKSFSTGQLSCRRMWSLGKRSEEERYPSGRSKDWKQSPCSLVQAYARNDLHQASRSFELRQSSITWNLIFHSWLTRTTLFDRNKSSISSLSEAACTQHTVLFDREDLEQDEITWGATIAALALNGQLQEGKVLFMWSVIFTGYAQQGYINLAREILPVRNDQSLRLERARGGSVEGFPDDEPGRRGERTFMNVVFACSHAGLAERAVSYFTSMNDDFGVVPCMVDALGRVGRVEQAEELVRRMPFSPSSAAWGALLGACRIHQDGDHERGVFAADGAM